MAWYSRINFQPSDYLHAQDINNLGLDIRTWGGDVNGGGYTLSNVVIAGLSATPGAVDSVFGRTGAVVAVAGDYTADQVGAVTIARQVIAGQGLMGGGALSSDVTLTAAVFSVFGRTGNVTLTPTDMSASGGVLNTRSIQTGLGLTGGGNLSADRTIAQIPDSVNQQVQVLSGSAPVGTRHAINFINGTNVTLTVMDDIPNNRVNVTIASTASGGMVDPTTAKGDLIVRGLTAIGRLPVGTDGQILTADSTQAMGVRWAVGAGSGAVASVFGRTGVITAAVGDYTAAQVSNAVDQTVSYTNPTWIVSLPWSKVTGAPAFFADPTSAKGDLLVRGTATLDRYPAGADGQVLIADSTQAHGVRWGTVTGGGGGGQSPWTSNIDGGNFTLGNVRAIGVGPIATNSTPATSPYPLYVSVGTAGVDANPNIASVLITDSHTQLQISCSVNYNSTGGGAPWIQAYQFGANTPTAVILQPKGGQVSIGVSQPAFSLDIAGDANVSGTYRINGTPITALSQTPWAQAIDGAGFVLNNTGGVGIGAPAGGKWLLLSYTNPIIRMVSPAGTDACMFQLQLGSSYSWEFGIGKPAAGSFYIYDAIGAGMRLQIDVNGNFGFGHPAAYRIDAAGDINCTGVFRVNGVPIGNVASVFGRTGAVVAVAGDYTAAMVTNAVSTAQVYADPAWIGSLAWSKIIGAPIGGVSSVFGRVGTVVAQAGDYTAAMVTNAISAASNYVDPVWITSLSWGKITGAPPIMSDPTTTLGDLIVRGSSLATQRLPVGTDGQVLTADHTQPLGVNWVTPTGGGSGAVISVFTRTGAVVAVAGDYSASQVTVGPAVFSATDVQTALTNASTAVNGKLSLTGGTLTGPLLLAADPTVNLGTATKQYVDNKVTGALHYIGSINASTGNVTYTTASGFTNGPLVAASAASQSYVICTNPGTIPSGPANGITLAMGDWLVSDGTSWSRLQVGTTGVTASQVSLAPNVFGAADVQTALGNAQTQVANKVDTSGSYANPTWITSLAWSKITGVPSALVSSVFGRTGIVSAQAGDYNASQITNAVNTQATYADPVWISSLSWPKISGTPNFLIDPLNTTGDLIVHGGGVTTRLPVGTNGQVLTADSTQTQGVRWAVPPSAPVSSVFGRTGVVQAQAGDYIAAQITNAVSTIGSYADPAWITSLSWSKITGAPTAPVASVFGRTGAVVAVSGDYSAAQITNAVSTIGSYADPAWITSLAWSKIVGAPAAPVTSVFGRTGAVVAVSNDYTAAQVKNAVDSTGTYSDPAWITALAWSKITGTPPIFTDPTTTKGDLIVHGTTTTRLPVGTDGQVLTADSTQTLGVKWGAAASGGFWLAGSGGAIYYNGGNVGIGTVSPQYKLEVHGTNGIRVDADNLAGVIGNAQLTVGGLSNTAKCLWMGFDTTNNCGLIQPGISGVGWNNLLLNPAGGNVGIGTATPQEALTAAGSIRALGSQQTNQANAVTMDMYVSGGVARFLVTGPSTTAYNGIYWVLSYSDGSGVTYPMVLTGAGNVGIGVMNPTYPLEVNGGGTGIPARLRSTIGNDVQLRFYGNQAAADIWAIGTDVTTGTGTKNFQFYDFTSGNSAIDLHANSGIDLNRFTGIQAGGNFPDPLTVSNIGSGGQIRMAYGSYGVMFRNDSSNFYVLLTASGDPWGSFNSLRPFSISLSNGYVAMNWPNGPNQLSVGGAISVSGGISGITGNTLTLDESGGNGRILFTGPDPSTYGTLQLWQGSSNGSAWIVPFRVAANNIVGIGSGVNPVSGCCQFRAGVDQNLSISGPVNITGAVALQAANDAWNANVPLEIRGNPVVSMFNMGIKINPNSALTVLSNDNSDTGNCLNLYANNQTQVASYSFGGINTTYYFKIGAPNGLWLQPNGPNVNIQTGATNGPEPLNISGLYSAGGQIRLAYGSYGVMLRNDNTNYWFLLTNAGDPWGGYNSLRPFGFNLSTGAVTMSQGVTISNGLTVYGAVNTNSTINCTGYYQNGSPFAGVTVPMTLNATAAGQTVLTVNHTFTSGNGVSITCNNTNLACIVISPHTPYSPTGGTWIGTSDVRTKRNVRPFEDGLAKLIALRPVYYEFNGLGGIPEGITGIGVVAQEAQDIVPYCVVPGPPPDPEAEIQERYLAFDASPVTWIMVNAIRELNDRLKILEQKLGVN